MSIWMFVIKNTDDVFEERIKNKSWPIYNRTPMKDKLAINDTVLFYKAGYGGQKFIGAATIASGLSKEEGKITYSIELKNIKIWKKPVDIRKILGKLEFILDVTNWGLSMQGGVRSISEKDFQTITLLAK